jgi:sugar lactone lactonase YvrE
VRRLLASWAVAVTICAAFAMAQNGPTPATIIVDGQNYPSSYLAEQDSGSALPGQPITVAQGLAPRALGVHSSSFVLFTRDDLPDRALEAAWGLSQAGAGAVISYQTHTALPVIGTGQAGSLGDGGAALSAELNLSTDSLFERSGIAVGANGTIFVADTKNRTIRSVGGTASGDHGIIRSVAGQWGPRQNVTLTEPMGIAVDRAGNLYIADHGAGAIDVLVAATGQLETLAHVISPASIAVTLDGTKVFVASPQSGGVFAIPTGTRAIEAVPGFAPTVATSESESPLPTGPCVKVGSASTSTPATHQVCPAGLAVDGRGNLFVADANAGKVLRVDATTNHTTVAASGLITPGDIAFDSKGDLFLSEQGRSRIMALGQVGDPPGNLTLTAPAPPSCTQGAAFTFCDEPVGGKTAAATFTLTNISATTAATGVSIGFNPPTTPGNFSVTGTSCTAALPANGSCTINVAFTPQTTGAVSSILAVTDTASDSATLTVTGTGDDYSVALASGQTSELTVIQGGTVTFKAVIVADSVFGSNGEKVTFACPSNLPLFTTCSFNPCPVSVTPGASTPFSIVIVTSSITVSAPPVTACGGQAASAPPQMQTPRMVLQAAPPTQARKADSASLLFPALAIFSVCGAIFATIWAGGCFAFAGVTAPPRSAAMRVPLIFAIAGLAAAAFTGCHGGSKTTQASTATPVGVTALTILANATDSNGNLLGTSRSLQFTLDVVAK